MTKKRVEIELDEDQLARLDVWCEQFGLTRDDFFARAASHYLASEQRRELFAREDEVLREAGSRFPDDKEAAATWVERRRRELGLDQAW